MVAGGIVQGHVDLPGYPDWCKLARCFQRMEDAVAGAVRPADRLHHLGLVEAVTLCGGGLLLQRA